MAHTKLTNLTVVKEFILLGLSDHPGQNPVLFFLFLAMYLITLGGNSSISTIIVADSQLHTPMYFFLFNLSVLDMCLTTVLLPKMLSNLLINKKTIPFYDCITQLYFFAFFATTEVFLLAVMAIDRYVAICRPLHYTTLMSTKVCTILTASSWIVSCLHSVLYSVLISNFTYCGPNQIQQFFCDVPPLLMLSCSDTSSYELLILTESSFILLVTLMSVVVSYMCIIYTILKMQTKEGRQRTFSTCSSHLIVVTLYYGTVLFNYIRPTSSYSLQKDKVMTVIYTAVTPMINPFIYCLRNTQVKEALRRVMSRYILQSTM
ncbi:olfactory receptor 5J3-like [Pleurodeles waltl]|uniref:olfactory receptor 5J3-like n=1 Tax=Pleurodeles waltl TaxID=8319 RepID=UPI00370940A0